MMHKEYTPNPLFEVLRRRLTKPQWQNLLALVLAVSIGRTLVIQKLSLFLLLPASSDSCYKHIQRLLRGRWAKALEPMRKAWVRCVIRCFAPGRGRLTLIIDWTMHKDRCRSLWVMLAVGGRAVPLCFWLSPNEMGGEGCQRSLEDMALREVASWLPKGRKVVLIGDRGFRGCDRIKLISEELGWGYVLRISADTNMQVGEEWVTLGSQRLEVGQRWSRKGVLLSKEHKVRANVVAAKIRLRTPQRKRTNDGKLTKEWVEESVWYLATNMDLREDMVSVYAKRMQIEQTFRDYKSLLGMEQEKTKQPSTRLYALMWALMIVEATSVWRAEGSAPPRQSAGGVVLESGNRLYRRQSATREGLHWSVVEMLTGRSPYAWDLWCLQKKSEAMQARPQVRDRRKRELPLKRRETTQPRSSPT